MSEIRERLETVAHVFAAPLASVMVFLHGYANEALARVQWNIDSEGGHYQMLVEDELAGQKTLVRWRAYSEFGQDSSSQKLNNTFFEKIRATESKMPGANETISDPAEWKKFVWGEAEKLGVKRDKLSTLKSRAAADLSTKIVQGNMRYAYDLIPDELQEEYVMNQPHYNPEKEKEIDAMPVDKLLTKKKEGVCRHFSVALQKVFEVFSNDPKGQFLQNTILRKFRIRDERHAINGILELKKDNRGNYFVDITLVDTTNASSGIGFSSHYLDPVKINSHQFPPLYIDYLQPAMSSSEQVQSNVSHIEIGKSDLASAPSIHINLAFTYLETLRSLLSKGKLREAEALFNHFQEFENRYKTIYQKDAATDEYDLLYSIFSNIYRLQAERQVDSHRRARIEKEGLMMRKESRMQRYEELLKRGEIKKALHEGEEYADLLAILGDHADAEKFYRSLFTIYQKNKGGVGIYERAMREGSGNNEQIVSIKPFENDGSFMRYLEYKKRQWGQK